MDFIRANVPNMAKWKRNSLLQWIGFCNDQDFCIPLATTLRKPKLEGLVIARPVMEVDQMTDPYAFDPEGRYIYVDVAIAKTPDMLLGIVLALKMRFGVREGVFWHRRGNNVLKGYGARKLLSRFMARHAATH